MQALKSYRGQEPAVSDLLDYAALVDEGIVQCKSGYFLAGYFYRGIDITSATVNERNYITARMNTALAKLGND